jgi:hypothetical protein
MKNIFSLHPLMTIVILALISFTDLSCVEKVVDVDLNLSDPHIVLEGSISDGSPCSVTVSQTVNFDEPNTFPPVSGAMITLRDNIGNTDSLTEFHPGTYSGSTIQGTPGRTYTLTVLVGGKEYVATSTMPSPVAIESLKVAVMANIWKTPYGVNVYFHYPHYVISYYHFVEYHNSVFVKSYITFGQSGGGQSGCVCSVDARGDKPGYGNLALLSVYSHEDTLRAGDIVQVNLECIDKGAFDYFLSIQESNKGGPYVISPANPVSNFSNGALGFFNAFSVRTSQIRVP